MESWIKGADYKRLHLGISVPRASATLPQTTSAAIYTIVGGKVLMTYIVGTITVILGAVGNMSLEENPTVGTLEALCAVVAAGTYAAGDLVGISGVAADAMLPAASGGVPGMTTKGVVLRAGTLDLRLSASSTGEIRWDLCYIPLDVGAYVTAA